MCQHRSYIYNKYLKRPLLVDCGKCPACQQDKASRRTARIRAEVSTGRVFLFVTLTYAPDYLPYINWLDDGFNHFCYKRYSDKSPFNERNNKCFYRVPIYRKYNASYVRKNSVYDFELSKTPINEPIDYADVPSHLIESRRGTSTAKGLPLGSVGVLYYKDFQDFIKRLRYYLPANEKFSTFSCGEYGPTTQRPHFHALISCSADSAEIFKAAIVKAWPFADSVRTAQNISIARNCASYVSSYVNCDNSIPPILRYTPAFRPCHHYSKGFGMALDSFSFSSVFASIKRRDLHYYSREIRDGVETKVTRLLPNYVVNYYFPKFKGYSRFTSHEVESVVISPSLLSVYWNYYGVDYTFEECQAIKIRLYNKRKFALDNGVSLFDYAKAYSEVYSIRSSNSLIDFYKLYNDLPNNFSKLHFYDNISSVFDGSCESPDLYAIALSFKPSQLISDPNLLPYNVYRTNQSERLYASYSKDKKVRNIALSERFQDF